MASRAYDEDLYRPGSRQRPIDEAYDDQKLQQEDFSRQQTTSTIANTARNRLESSQRPINEAISNTFDKAENSSDVPPELIAQITQNVIEQLQKSIGFDGASPIQTQQSQFPPPPPPHPPPHVQHHDWPRSISPSTTASGTSSANMLERALTLPSSRSSDYAGHTSPPLPQSHAPEPKTSSLKGYKAAASSLNRPSSPISRTSNASDGHGDRSSRPRGTTRLHTGMEKTVLEKIWGPLFDEDGRPTLRLSQFLRGLAVHIARKPICIDSLSAKIDLLTDRGL